MEDESTWGLCPKAFSEVWFCAPVCFEYIPDLGASDGSAAGRGSEDSAAGLVVSTFPLTGGGSSAMNRGVA